MFLPFEDRKDDEHANATRFPRWICEYKFMKSNDGKKKKVKEEASKISIHTTETVHEIENTTTDKYYVII